ncbi:MAG: FecR domain-containing protein [Firmicutes bacterium]|nr:FecR domain-containing protein [Bacillota bacterium]
MKGSSKVKPSWMIILVLVVFLAWVPEVIGQNQKSGGPARLSEYSGDVQLFASSGEKLKIQRGLVVEPGSVVVTGEKSYAFITWGADYCLWVDEQTELTLAQGTWRQDPPSLWSRLRLTVGRVWVDLVRKANDLIEFSVETPTVSAGVRGTAFRVEQLPSGECEVSVKRGVVEVVSGDYSAEVKEHQYIFFTAIGQTEGPKSWSPRIRNQWEERGPGGQPGPGPQDPGGLQKSQPPASPASQDSGSKGLGSGPSQAAQSSSGSSGRMESKS